MLIYNHRFISNLNLKVIIIKDIIIIIKVNIKVRIIIIKVRIIIVNLMVRIIIAITFLINIIINHFVSCINSPCPASHSSTFTILMANYYTGCPSLLALT